MSSVCLSVFLPSFVDFKDYIEPLLTTLSDFLAEWEKETEGFMQQAAGPPRDKSKGNDKDSDEDEEGFGSFRRSSGGTGGRDRGRVSTSVPLTGDRSTARRESHQVTFLKQRAMSDTLSVDTGVNSLLELEKLPLTYKLVKRFLGDASYRDLRIMIDGYELLDIKGLGYWKERIEKYELRLTDMRQLIATQLEEKRNFTSFLLTIVTTVLAPLTIMTGYFGMNFENMDELNPATYPHFPGVKIMWAMSGFLYLVMLLFAMHFRVIYSAT
jgi:hypothetical protein